MWKPPRTQYRSHKVALRTTFIKLSNLRLSKRTGFRMWDTYTTAKTWTGPQVEHSWRRPCWFSWLKLQTSSRWWPVDNPICNKLYRWTKQLRHLHNNFAISGGTTLLVGMAVGAFCVGEALLCIYCRRCHAAITTHEKERPSIALSLFLSGQCGACFWFLFSQKNFCSSVIV